MTSLTILDVGHGNSAVLQSGDNAVVIDAGPGTSLLEHLLSSGVEHLDEVLISHSDADHLRGLQRLLDENRFGLGRIRVNSDAAQRSQLWNSLIYSLDDRHRQGHCEFGVSLVEGETIDFRDDCNIRVLAPRAALAATGPGNIDNQGRRITANTASAVVSVRVANTTALLTGDLDEVGLDHLLASGQDLKSNILVFPHHGGNVSGNATRDRNRHFAERLMDAVRPDVVVFSFARRQGMNPRPEFIQVARADGNSKILCTQMSLHCSPENTFDEGHLSDVYAAGRKQNVCCAGSIRITGSDFRPSLEQHTSFVLNNAPTALCTRNRS